MKMRVWMRWLDTCPCLEGKEVRGENGWENMYAPKEGLADKND